MIGQENEVPLASEYDAGPFADATFTRTPRADRSGLIRPSAVGPTELKLARVPSVATAPIASTRIPSAGAPSVLWSARNPPLPAEFTTTTPRSAAIAATRVVIAV